MAYIIEEYVDRNGVKYALKAFENIIYHPQELRKIQRENAEFYQSKQADSQAALKASQQAKAKAAAPLSDDEYYELKLAEDKRRKLEQLLIEQQQADALRQRELELNDTSQPTINLCSTNPIVFLNEFAARTKQGYVIDEATLNFSAWLYAINMTKKVKQ